jgi:hypothetical protein
VAFVSDEQQLVKAQKKFGNKEKNRAENLSFQTFVQSFADDYFSGIISRKRCLNFHRHQLIDTQLFIDKIRAIFGF